MKRIHDEFESSDEEEVQQTISKKASIETSTPSSKSPWSIGKLELREINNGKVPGYAILMSKIHTQAKGFAKVEVKNETTDEIIRTKYVKCLTCDGFYSSDGGHLRRHQKTCSESKSSTTDSKDRSDRKNAQLRDTTITDFHEKLIEYFACTGFPLNLLDNPHFKQLLSDFAELGQRYNGVCDNSILLKRVTARKHVEAALDEKKSGLFESLAPFFNDKTIAIMVDFGKLSVDFLSVKGSYIVTTTDDDGNPVWKTVIAPIAMAPAKMGTKDAYSVYKIIRESIENCFEDF
ncbi:unnamed protein product [Caenorhabditis brenneri]